MFQPKFKSIFILLLLASLVFGHVLPVVAQKNTDTITEYINDYDRQHRQNTHTVGWGFAYVDDGGSVVRTFGLKQIESKQLEPKPLASQQPVFKHAVSGDTVFRIASVSKVFVAIAVQRLLEENTVELDVDIVRYLPEMKEQLQLQFPTTLRHLLTHTAGFEDKFYGDSTRLEADTESLEMHLLKALPKQIHEPGKFIRYSNYGSALAAIVVEKVSKMPFHQYVQEFILKPSGMESSGYMLTEQLQPDMASGYRFKDGEYQQRPYTWVHRYPPTSMLTTANDMAKFIKMLVSGGMGHRGRVLSTESVEQMFATQFAHDEDIPGMALGWMEFQRYGNKTLYHDGGTPGFAAQLVIIPEQKAGYFIVANQKNSRLPEELRYDFLKHFFDNANSQTEEYATVEPSLPLADYIGSYQTTRRNDTSFEKFAVLMSREIEVQLFNAGKSISTGSGSNSSEGDDSDSDASKSTLKSQSLRFWDREYTPYDSHKFVHQQSGHKLVFKVQKGKVIHLTLDWGGAPRAYKKLSLIEQRNSQMVMLGIILICSLLTWITLIVLWVKYGKRVRTELLANSLILVFFLGLAAFAITLDSMLIRLDEITSLKLLLGLPVLALFTIVLHLVQKKWQWYRLLALTPVILGLFWLNNFNLLGWWFY